MEEILNYALYGIACICILVPFIGFGVAPLVIIKAALGLFVGNSYSQVAEQNLLKSFINDNSDNKKLKPFLPALQMVQNKIDHLEDPEISQQKKA
jgi:hypothetical protein